MNSEHDEVVRRVERGCPQGSIAGPTLWNLCMNDLLNDLSDMHVEAVAYADDLLLLIEGGTRRLIESRAGEVMQHVYGWGKRVGVDVSDSKTVCMVLKGSLDMLNRVVHVRLHENDVRRIKFVSCVKYLGVSMGTSLNFRAHVDGMRRRVAVTMGKLRRVMRKDWGLKKGVVSVLVKGLLIPAIMYGASVWYGLTRLKGVREELNRCQRCALYACIRVCRTVSTEAMQVIFGSLPWDIDCVRMANLYKLRKGHPMHELDLVRNNELDGLRVDERRKLINDRAYEMWQHRWNESACGRVTFKWLPDVRFSGRTNSFEPNLHVCFILTGHGSLNAFLYSRNLRDSPDCVCGYAREDWVHLLCECEMYEGFRNLEEMKITRRGNNWDVSEVIKDRAAYESMCRFVGRAYRMRASIIARTEEVNA